MCTNLTKRNFIDHHTPLAREDGREHNLTWGIEVVWKLECSSSKSEHGTPFLIERVATTKKTHISTTETNILLIDGDFAFPSHIPPY